MLIPSRVREQADSYPSLSRRVNANSQLQAGLHPVCLKLIKKGEC